MLVTCFSWLFGLEWMNETHILVNMWVHHFFGGYFRSNPSIWLCSTKAVYDFNFLFLLLRFWHPKTQPKTQEDILPSGSNSVRLQLSFASPLANVVTSQWRRPWRGLKSGFSCFWMPLTNTNTVYCNKHPFTSDEQKMVKPWANLAYFTTITLEF